MVNDKRIRRMLWGGAVLSLALLVGAAAQDDAQAPVEAPPPVQLHAAVDEERDFVVVQERDAVLQAQEEAVRDLLKALRQAGVPEEDIQDILGDMVLSEFDRAAPEEIDASNTVVREATDGEALYLPIGTTLTYTAEQGTTLELPFTADGPGMLTVAFAGASQVQVVDSRGGVIDWQSDRYTAPRGAVAVSHALVPIGAEGEFTVRVGVPNGGEVKVGAEWIPFPQMSGARSVILPVPDPETELVLVPDRLLNGSINKNDQATEHLWCRYDADADGQLVVLANADQGDITMRLFNEGHYQREVEYVDDDLNGSVANEGLVVDVQAGRTYYVRVDMRSGQRCNVAVRAGWVPLAEEE